jgi:hypothetical protein
VAGALAVAGQLHFAWQFPFDKQGMVKGHYLQFVAPVFCTVFGVAVAWLWQRGGWLRVIAVLEGASLLSILVYVLRTRQLIF